MSLKFLVSVGSTLTCHGTRPSKSATLLSFVCGWCSRSHLSQVEGVSEFCLLMSCEPPFSPQNS
jgi:hypothetical protein